MRTPWMLLAPLLFSQALFAADAELNWVKNGDFVSREAWTGDALFVEPGRDGGRAAVLVNQQARWSTYKQSVALPKPTPPVVEVSFGMKSQDVKPGSKPWELNATIRRSAVVGYMSFLTSSGTLGVRKQIARLPFAGRSGRAEP